jgi:pseudaminic acid cytidylyltransferase
VNLAIIPARGGSQRIPRKNIRDFFGKPIIGYSIQAARESGCFDEVMVSTDDDQIAEVARSFGATTPFKRSAAASSNTAITVDVLLEVLGQYRERGTEWDNICCIYPTAPFVSAEVLKAGMKTLLGDPKTNAVISVVRFSYPIQRALKLRDGHISMFQPEHLTSRSQDLETAFHDAGQFYWLKTRPFLTSKSLMAAGTAGLELPERRVQDIDTEEDWALAEMKFQMLHRASRP